MYTAPHNLYTYDEVMQFVESEDVKFIRLAFCDVRGRQKNVSVMPGELKRAVTYGVSFDASAVPGFAPPERSDLFLHPDLSTLAFLPWRPTHGRVVRAYCDVRYPDGTPFGRDCRQLLRAAVRRARERGLTVSIGTEYEFYLFCTDETGAPTKRPFDSAGYMDIAPEDKGENIRREICFALCDMDITPESSHHEEGPGQNEIDFRYRDAMTAADNATTFKMVVRTIAMQNGLFADFSPKPLPGESGNGMHINLSVKSAGGENCMDAFMAGILARIGEITAFLNPTEESYARLGACKAPAYVSWARENRSALIRIPAAQGDAQRMELRSPDPEANPYLAFALLIHAGLDGVEAHLAPPPPVEENLFDAPASVTDALPRLPGGLEEASRLARESEFIRRVLPGGADGFLVP